MSNAKLAEVKERIRFDHVENSPGQNGLETYQSSHFWIKTLIFCTKILTFDQNS